MKIISILIILSAAYLAFTDNATDRTNNEQSATKKEISKDTTLILDFVSKDTFIQRYIIDPSFRVKIKEANKKLK